MGAAAGLEQERLLYDKSGLCVERRQYGIRVPKRDMGLPSHGYQNEWGDSLREEKTQPRVR